MAKRNIYTAIETDNYRTYDEFVNFIKDFYAPDDNEKAYEVEDFINGYLAGMFTILDTEYLKQEKSG